MSFATDTLAIIQAAYQEAVSSKSLQLNGRGKTQQEINDLLAQMEYWENRVAAETASTSGGSIRKPMQVVV